MFCKRFMASIARASIDTEVLIIGGGPAGLSAAIKLKQLNPNRHVMVVEKGAFIGRLLTKFY